ncbi:MAG: alpha-glucuronidase family glycosyl hydrolase, partial [Maribacter sp.]
MRIFKISLLFFCLSFIKLNGQALEDYKLWLKYNPVEDAKLGTEYSKIVGYIYLPDQSDILKNARAELSAAIPQMLGKEANYTSELSSRNTLIIDLFENLPNALKLKVEKEFETTNEEGFLIKTTTYRNSSVTVISAKKEIGILYGVFRFLHLMQTHEDLKKINLNDSPKIQLRMLNHWDNLDRTVERGYAGFSLWNWQKLPGYIDERYIDYARTNASIGINAISLTNVNANALVLTP